MNPFLKVSTRTTESSQTQPWVAGGKRSAPRTGERQIAAELMFSVVPDGTRFVFAPQPSDEYESLGYYRASLRDLDSRHAVQIPALWPNPALRSIRVSRRASSACRAVPSAGAPTGAAEAAALPIMKAQMNTAQPARNQSSFNRGLRGWARIREGESVISAKSVVKSPRQSAFNLIELLVVIAVRADPSLCNRRNCSQAGMKFPGARLWSKTASHTAALHSICNPHPPSQAPSPTLPAHRVLTPISSPARNNSFRLAST